MSSTRTGGVPKLDIERRCRELDRELHGEAENWTGQALSLVAAEREAQDQKWQRRPGVWDRPAGVKALVLGEEYGEVCNAVLERKPDTELLAELIQTAAVCVAWAEVILAGNRADGMHKG